MFRIADVPRARQLVTLLSVFSSALSIGLPGNGGVTAVPATDATGREDNIDGSQAILHAIAVMLNASCVQQKTLRGLPPEFGRLHEFFLRDPTFFGRAIERPLIHMFGELLEARRMLPDEVMVDPVPLDHDPQHAVEQRGVTPRAIRGPSTRNGMPSRPMSRRNSEIS